MASIRGWLAASLDSYIASPDGSIDWLRKYDSVDFGEFGYEHFIATIRTIVMGRATYDAIAGYDDFDWPYGEKRTIVVTSRPIEEPLGPLETWTEGVDSLTAYLRGLDDGDVWMMGGGKLQQSFIERGALDTLEIVVVPELVGGGIPLFPPTGFSRSVRLVDAGPLPAGCVRLLYDFQVNGGLSV